MGKPRLTVFVCRGKSCRKAWAKVTDSSPGKWVKRLVEGDGLHAAAAVAAERCGFTPN